LFQNGYKSSGSDYRIDDSKFQVKKVGRPPRTQIAVVRVLKQHPELWVRPKTIAAILNQCASFRGITGRAVSQALSKVRNRNRGLLEIDSVCEDCLGRIGLSGDNHELACFTCGRSYGPLVEDAIQSRHSEVTNLLWSAYESNKQIIVNGFSLGRKVSHDAARIQEFGLGVKGKLTRRAFLALAEICKSHTELEQDKTNHLARLVAMQCEIRTSQILRVSESDAKDCITLALLQFARDFPIHKDKMVQMIQEICVFFPDVAASPPKCKKSASQDNLDYLTFRSLD
jgi:hypothetical protein